MMASFGCTEAPDKENKAIMQNIGKLNTAQTEHKPTEAVCPEVAKTAVRTKTTRSFPVIKPPSACAVGALGWLAGWAGLGWLA